MKVLVLFGSSSDDYVYNPLIEKLKHFAQVDFAVISAHRNPVELEERLKRKDYDVIVAGAGLAAHLPGVIASKVDVPVFGIPVEAVLGGIDALMSIQQMPFGVPVLACAPGQSKKIVEFLEAADKVPAGFFNKINIVIPKHVEDYEYTSSELKRTLALTTERNIETTQSNSAVEGCMNIHLVTQASEISKEALAINVPLLEKTFKENPYKVTDLYDLVKEGGLWVGVNNTRNAVVFTQKLAKGRA